MRNLVIAVTMIMAVLGTGIAKEIHWEIKTLLETFHVQVAENRLDSSVFDPHTGVLEETKSSISKLYSTYKNPDIAQFTTGVEISDDSAFAVVSRKVNARVSDQSVCDMSWLTCKIENSNIGWKITEIVTRKYAQTKNMDIQIELFPDTGKLTSTASLEVEILATGETELYFNLNRDLELDSIFLGDVPVRMFQRNSDTVCVPFDRILTRAESFNLTFVYSGTLDESGKSRIGADGCFASWNSHWYPRLMGAPGESKGYILFTVPESFTVICNGIQTTQENGFEKSKQAFRINQPLDWSFAAAQYSAVNYHDLDGIRIGIYLLSGNSQQAALYLLNTGLILRSIQKIYQTYPFDSYNIVEIPTKIDEDLKASNEQGMNFIPENLIIDGYFNLPFFAHQIGHSWWCDSVSGDKNILINESLAQVSALMCLEDLGNSVSGFLKNGKPGFRDSARTYFSCIANSPHDMDLASRGNEDSQLLYSLANLKGPFVFLMLRDEIGQDAFLKGLRQIAHSRNQVSLKTLQQAWENSSGMPLDWFFTQWFHRTGAPEFRVEFSSEEKGAAFLLSGSLIQDSVVYRASVPLRIWCGDEFLDHTVMTEDPITNFELDVPFRPDKIELDPDYTLFRWTDEFRELNKIQEGNWFVLNKDWKKAAESLEAFKENNSADLHLNLARAYKNLNELDKAEQIIQNALDKISKTEDHAGYQQEFMLLMGDIQAGLGRVTEAGSWYKKVLQNKADSYSEALARNRLAKL